VQRILSGERLPDTVRDGFLAEARSLYDAQQRRYERDARNYRSLAERAGLDPADVVVPFDDEDLRAPAAAARGAPAVGGGGGGAPAAPAPRPPGPSNLPRPSTPAEAARLPPGTRYVTPDGR